MTSLLTSPKPRSVADVGALLAPIQQAMLATHASGRNPGVDVEQIVCSLGERVDPASLERAWQGVVDANDALRVRIAWERDGEPLQFVAPQLAVPFEWRPSHGLDEPARDATVVRFLETDRRRGFDLETAPLMRLTLFEFDDEDWRLVWSFHHVLLDGRSFALVLEDVFTTYDALVASAPTTLPVRPTYSGYGGWAARRDTAADRSFWRDALRGVTAATPLPFRAVTPRVHAPATADHDVRLSPDETAALRRFASAHGVSVGTLIHAAWALVLARHAHVDEVVFGAVVACGDYTGDDTDDALGVCINSVPLRLPIPGAITVEEWLRDVRARWLALREHRHLPLAEIHGCSEVPRGSALFASLVMYDRYELEERLRSLGGAWAARHFRLFEQNGFPLTLGAYAGESLLLRFEYDPRELDARDVERLAARVVVALRTLSADPSCVLADVDLMLPGEREQVLEQWNATATSFDLAPLPEMIAAQAEWTPDAIAVVTEAGSLTYRELVQRAGVVARFLASQGVGPGSFVGVCISRSEPLVTALVGVLQAGAAYVPLDPEYPPQRLAQMRDDSEVRVILATTETAARLRQDFEDRAARLIEIDREWTTMLAADPATPLHAPSLDDPAYMIYTSGSTGVPKGAINGHRAIANRLLWMQSAYRLDGRDAVLQKTPASFDVSVWEFFWPLVTGARLVLATPGGHRDPAYLRDVICRERISVMHFVPSMLRAFLDEDGIERCSIDRGGTLRDVVCSGEALPFDLQERFFERLPRVRLHNLYGPTEAAVDVTAWTCVQGDERGIVPIGRPIANTRMYVLDAARRPVPVGVPGELYIGGVQVGLGYWRRPELTAERFVADPFAESDAARMYRTGDLARWRADGTIEYLGRIDDQVKLRGQRIELGEIEAALSRQPEVRAAAVALRDDRRGAPQLVAYCVPMRAGDDSRTLREVLRERLAQLLPAHMIPTAIVRVDALPLGATGKLDRRALPVPAESDVIEAPDRVIDPPRDATEATITRIFAELLGVERVGRTDNFFRLGGDSILLIRAVSAARRAGLVVSLREVAAEPTVAAFAAAATSAGAVTSDESRSASTCAPLTPIQRWFFAGITDGRDHWNQALVLRPRSRVSGDVVRAAVTTIVARHAALRTRFETRGDEWTQTVVPLEQVTIDFEIVDADALAVDHDVAVRQIGTVAQQALSLSAGQLVAARYVASDVNGDRLILVAHHLAVDGVSWRIIAEELEEACDTSRSSRSPESTSDGAPFTMWSEGLHRLAASGAVAGEREFWQRVIGSDSSRLARDHEPIAPSVAASTRTVLVALPDAVTLDLIRDVPRAFDTRINAVLLAALGDALGPCVDGDRVLVDLEGHGREDVLPGVDVAHTVGWFTSMFPIALDVARDATLAERVRRMDATLRAIPDHGIGYGILRYLCGESALAGAPRDVVFNYFGRLDPARGEEHLFDVAASDVGPLRGARTARRHLLEVNCAVRAGRFEAALEYDATLLDFATVSGIADRFGRALARLASAASNDGNGIGVATSEPAPIEDSYALTPLQRLFYAFDASERDPGLQQWRFRIEGALDPGALHAAWQAVVDRHSMLRTAFVRGEDGEPRQVVYGRATLPWDEIDLGALRGDEQRSALERLLQNDRAAGLPFERAPLMRIILMHLGNGVHEVIWTHHHAALDRWSWPLVLHEVGVEYAARCARRPAPLPAAVPFSAYVRWLARQDEAKAEGFWRHACSGLARIPRFRRPEVAPEIAETAISRHLRIDARMLDALRAAAGRMGVSLNAVLQSAWALTLAHVLGTDDLLVGMVVTGRPADLDDADRIVGPMVANVPLRVRVTRDVDLATLVRAIAEEQFAVQEQAWVAPERIEEWSGQRGRLLESLIVFHDAASDGVAREWVGSEATVTNVNMPTRTEYPVTLVVGATHGLSLSLHADAARVAESAIDPILAILEGILVALTRDGRSVADVLDALPPEARGQSAEVAIDEGGDGSAAEDTASRSALESVLADMWCDVLGVAHVRARDTFFSLGGNSLGAMKLVGRIADVLRVRLPIRAVFAGPTLDRLADAVRAYARDAAMPDRIAELVRRVGAMSDAEVGSTLDAAQDTVLTGSVE